MNVKYYNLVRDNIPDKIINNGEKPYYRELNDEEFWNYLLKKDVEELEEVKKAPTLLERKKELADKYEVLKTMIEASGFTLEEIIEEAKNKKEANGGFERRLLLLSVDEK